MIKGIYQSCYTNTETAGWMSVAASPELPAAAADYCVRSIHGKNSQIDNNAVDERGNTLNLFECDSDGEYLYLTHTQYGLISRDRPSMFAHTYIFPWDEEQLVDPNKFLTFDDTNFYDNEADAMSDIPAPMLIEPFSVTGIVSKYGITKDNLKLFIGAVVNQFTKSSTGRVSLYIQYDGTELQMRELLYLMYKLTPRYMRKQICAASCDCSYTREKPIIFSMRASSKHAYVDAFEGRSNVLDEAGLKKLQKNGYPLYAAENYDTTDIDKYFADLEVITEKITGNTSANKTTLQACHKICTGVSVEDMDDNSAIDQFFDVLELDSQTDFYFDYLARCFKKAVECKLTLNETAEKYLIDTIKQSKEDSNLRRVYCDYEVSKISKLTETAAVDYLRRLDNDRAVSICRTLLEQDPSDKNKTVVCEYYKQVRLKTNTFDGLSEVISEMLSIPGLVTDQMTESIRIKASDYYLSYIFNADIALFEKYKDILKQLYNDDEIDVRITDAKNAFWQKLRFKNVKFDKSEFYALMAQDSVTVESMLFEKYIALPGYYLNEGIAAYIRNTFEFFNLEEFKAMYSGDDMNEAVLALIGYLTPQTNDGGARIKSYTNIATVDLTFNAAIDAIVDLLEKVDEGTDYQTLSVLFKSVTETIRECAQSKGPFVVEEVSTGLNILKVNLIDSMIAGLRERDDKGDVVPLDLWLIIGKFSVIYTNPFSLLEQIQPRILNEDSLKVVRENTLMLRSDFLDDAKKYIQNRVGGNTTDAVKAWIRLYQNGVNTTAEPAPMYATESTPTVPFATPRPEEQSVFVTPAPPAEEQVGTESSYQDFTSEQSKGEPQKDSGDNNSKKGLGGIFGGIFKK